MHMATENFIVAALRKFACHHGMPMKVQPDSTDKIVASNGQKQQTVDTVSLSSKF